VSCDRLTGGLKIYVDVVCRTVGCDANFICNISRPQSWHDKQLPRRRRLCFLAIMLASSLNNLLFLLGAAGDQRTAADIAFYERVKASVGDAEATTLNEDLPGTAAGIVAQAREFKEDITRNNRRSTHYYCLIGRNFHELKSKHFLNFTPDACREVNYSYSYIIFLINLYKFSVHYPKIKRVNIGVCDLKSKFKALKEGVTREPQFWKTI